MTANPEKGEVELVIEGVSYVLVMSFAGMIALQNKHTVDGVKPPVEAVFAKAQRGDLEAFRDVFWALFLRHHPEVTPDTAGRLMDDAGGLQRLDALLAGAMVQGQPDPRDVAAVERLSGRPPNAAATRRRRGGTGGRSS